MSTRTHNPKSNRSLALILISFLAGVIGTVVVVSRISSRPLSGITGETVAAEDKAREAGDKPAADRQEGGVIKLSDEAIKTAGIRVETARIAPMREGMVMPGIVEVSPNREAKVTPPASGKIVKLLAAPGDSVAAGQPLAVLRSFDAAQGQAAVRQAETGIKQAEAGLQTAESEVAQAKSSVPIAEAEVAQAKTKLASAEQALSRQKELASAGAFSQAPLQAAQQELTDAQSELIIAQKEDAAHDIVLARTQRLFAAELVSQQELEQGRLRHEQTQNRVDRAKSRYELAQRAYAREKKIAEAGLLNAREVQTAEADVRASHADVFKAQQGVTRAQQDVRRALKGESAARTSLRGAQAALSAARENLSALVGQAGSRTGGEITVIAPIGGTVTERPATLGEVVERTAALFVIENLNTVSVLAHVPEKDVARVRAGQPVEVSVSAYPRVIFPGVVQSIGSRIDEKTRALPVRCVLENRGGRLRPKMFARVSLIVGARSNVVAVPLSSLDEHGAVRSVFVQQGQDFVKRSVEVGRRTDATVEILSGVKAGERVAVAGVFVLESESRKNELKGDD